MMMSGVPSPDIWEYSFMDVDLLINYRAAKKRAFLGNDLEGFQNLQGVVKLEF